MASYTKFNIKKMSLWLTCLFVFGLILYFIDVYFFQKHAFLFLSDYSGTVLAIWQVQATVVTLSMAVTAYITSRFDTYFYGISIKELLYYPRKHPDVLLSYWEVIVFTILTLGVAFIFVLLENMASTFFVFLFSLCCTVYIVRECIYVITKSERYSIFAKSIVDELKTSILESTCSGQAISKLNQNDGQVSLSDGRPKELITQLETIIDKIDEIIAQKIRARISLRSDETYQFFEGLVHSFKEKKETGLPDYLFNIIYHWTRQAIEEGAENNLPQIVTLSLATSTPRRTDCLQNFMYRYYYGELGEKTFKKVIQYVSTIIQSLLYDETSLAIDALHISILFADVETFRILVKSIWESNLQRSPEKRGKALLFAYIYLYYMTLKETLVTKDKGKNYIDTLKELVNAIVFITYFKDTSVEILFRDLIKNNFKVVFSDVRNVLNRFSSDNSSYEYLSVGVGKWLQLDHDAIEFIAFALFAFYRRKKDFDFSTFTFDELAEINKYVYNAKIKGEFLQSFIAFCNWLSVLPDEYSINVLFEKTLVHEIKTKLVSDIQAQRSKSEYRNERLRESQNLLQQKMMASSVYIDAGSSSELFYEHDVAQTFDVEDFSERISLFGLEDTFCDMIEFELLRFCLERLERVEFENPFDKPEDAVDKVYDAVDKLHGKKVHINAVYNYDIFEQLEFISLPEEYRAKLNELHTQIKNLGIWSKQQYSAIYVDTNKQQYGFTFSPATFWSVIDYLSEAEIEEEMKEHKVADGYIFREKTKSVDVFFEENEFREFLKTALIKITIHVKFRLPTETIGFYTVEKQQEAQDISIE